MKHPNAAGRRLLVLVLCAALLTGALPTVRSAERVDITDRFTDPEFLDDVYTSVRKKPGQPIYDTDVAQVRELYVSQYSYDPEIKIQSPTGLEYFTGLEILEINHCELPALDVRPLKHLRVLRCHANRLKTLDLRGLDELTTVDCSDNALTELFVSSPVLQQLRCDGNLLTSLDLSGCPALDSLNCENNALTSLDLSACPNIRYFACRYNYMSGTDAITGYDPPSGPEARFYFDPQNDERLVPPLDDDTRARICADYARVCPDTRLSPEDVRIEQYYGCYDGLYIVYLRLDEPMLEGEPKYRRIGGYVFYFPHEYSRRLLAWRDGECIPVQEAFASGALTRTGLRGLFDRFYENTSFPFADVTADAWYYGIVRDAQYCLLFNGVSEDRFAPEQPMTRAMLVAVLWRLFGEPYVDRPDPFDDVPNRSWYANAVTWAAENKLIEGVGDGRFAPDAPVTREQLVTILHRMEPRPEPAASAGEGRYPDFAQVSPGCRDALRWAVSLGIVEGSKQADGTLLLHPGASATRAEAAALLMRYIDRLPDRYPTFQEDDQEPSAPPVHAQYAQEGGRETLTLTNLLNGETAVIDVTGLLPADTGGLRVCSGTCAAFGWEITYYLQRAADGTVLAVAEATEPTAY